MPSKIKADLVFNGNSFPSDGLVYCLSCDLKLQTLAEISLSLTESTQLFFFFPMLNMKHEIGAEDRNLLLDQKPANYGLQDKSGLRAILYCL